MSILNFICLLRFIQTNVLLVHQNSEGTYYCQPNNDLGTGSSSYVNLRVFQPPRFIGQLPPVLQKKAQDADFNMTCSAQGKPKPSITWLKDGVEILPGSSSGAYELVTDESEGRNAIFTVRSTLRFHGSERPALSQLTADDRGVYTCAFENQIRRIESTLTLKIEHAPILLDHRPKVASNVGSSSIQLLCQVQAYPRPNFEWSLRDVPIIGGGGDSKYEMNVTSMTDNGHDIYQGILRINDVKESDYGDYTCKMWNAEGENAAAVRLQATSAPEKPTNLRVVQSGYDSLALEWDEGFNGGFENTIYTVLYRAFSSSSNAGQQQEDDCQYANPCVIRGLEQLQSYTIQVRAENTKGKSPLSNALTASTIVDLSRIPEPKQVTFEPKTKTISFNVDSQLPLMAMVESRIDGDWSLSQRISVRSPVSREVLDLVKDDVDDVRIKLCLEMNTTLCSEAVVAVTGDLIQEPTKALTDLPAKYMVAIIVACVVGSLVFVLFAIFYCYRRRRAQKLKKLLEMEKAHSARPTIGQQQQQQQQPPPPYYAGLENKGRDASLMDTSHGSMLDDAASKNALYATQNGYGYAVGSAQNNGHANGDWVNMAYTEHSYSNSNNGGSVNSQDSLWQLKLASQNGGVGGVNGGDHQLGNGALPDRSYHYDPMTHGGYGGFEDYSHYPPSTGDDYMQRNNYGAVTANGDPYAAVHKNGKRMEHLESTYHNVSGLPDPYMEAEPEEMKQHQQQQQQQQMAPPQHISLSFDESLESGYSTPNSRNRRVIREIIV
ncbi:protein turtle homolog B-like [Daphnia carinata]|uniref:protein turtle homolog B-like n=1 Tax=Daphnia carinata TaxID=120202 RepID=UPI0028686C9B|nr:protein turtle homolog B-like [Daphnia carinata]